MSKPRAEQLVAEIALLQARQDVIKAELDSRKAELRVLMAQGGLEGVKTTYGTASSWSYRSFSVVDRLALATLFSPEVLALRVQVDATFYDAAKRMGVPIEQVVSVSEDTRLRVMRARSKEAKARFEQIIQEERAAAEREIQELVEAMGR